MYKTKNNLKEFGMVKKILMAVGVLTIVGVIAAVGISYYLGNKIGDEIEKRVPEFRQYVTMTTEEQNAYISKNIDEIYEDFFSLISNNSVEKSEMKSVLTEMDKKPELMQAKINWGRSMVAGFILNIEDLRKDLTPEDLKKFQAEKAEYEVRLLEYRKQINIYKIQHQK